MKNIHIFITTLQSPHLEYLLNFAKTNSIHNNVLIYDFINGSPYRHDFTFRICKSLRLNLSRFIRNGYLKYIWYENYIKKNNLKKVNVFNLKNISESKNSLTHKEIFNILKSYTSNESGTPFLNEDYSKFNNIIKLIKLTSSASTKIAKKINLKNKNEFILFNGRLPCELSIKLTFKKYGFNNFYYHEINQTKKKFILTNHSVHEMRKYGSKIIEYKKQISEKENFLMAKKIMVLQGCDDKLIKFSKYNVKIPKALNKKLNILYFTSSLDEFLFTHSNVKHQSEVIFDLINFFKKNNSSFLIRVHPNIATKHNYVKNYWNRFKKLYLDICVNFDEKRSSYKLCKKSDLTISMGSSMGAQSLILGVPHIQIGNISSLVDIPSCKIVSEKNYINEISNEILKLRRSGFKISTQQILNCCASLHYFKNSGQKQNIKTLAWANH